MAGRELTTDLTKGSVTKQLLTFAGPLFLSNALQSIYGAVDMAVVGRYLGSAGLSGVSIGGDILSILVFIAMGFSGAGQVIISQYLGAGKKEKVKDVVGTMCVCLLIIAAVMSSLCFFLRYQLLDLLNAPAEAREYALSYIVTCICGVLFIYGYNAVSSVLRGMGNSRQPFIFVSIAAVLNLILDIIFVTKFNMGVFGAALATVIGQAVSFICAVVFLYKRREQFGFDFRISSFRIDKQVIGPLVRLGIPMAIKSASVLISRLVIDSWVNVYGVVYSGVSGIGNKIGGLSSIFSTSLSAAGGAMMAQNIGAEKYDRVKKTLGTALLISICCATCFTALTVLSPMTVFGIFTSDPEVLEVCKLYVPVAILIYYATSLNSPFGALITGSGNARLNLLSALMDGLVGRIGLAVLLGFVLDLGIIGFWYAHALAIYMPFFVGFFFFLSGKWKTRNNIIHDN